MTNSFLRFDVSSIPVQLGAAGLCAIAGVAAGLSGSPMIEHVAAIAAAILAFACALRARAIFRVQGGANKIEEACRQISEGNFEARITNIDDNSSFSAAAHAVNDVIDRCDAFVREATASMDAVCRGVYYRQIVSVGMNGAFRIAAETINSSVQRYGQAVADARRAAEAEKAEVADAIAKGLARLADKDMTFRLGAELPEAYARLTTDFNSAVDALESTLDVVLEGAHSISSSTSRSRFGR